MLFKSLLLASTASASCLHGVFKREEGAVEIPKFGYEGSMGPLNWHALAPENEACRTGTNQAPINIDSTVKFAASKPTIEIPQQSVVFENLNTTIEVVMKGTTTFDSKKFEIAQFHMHTPSENRINREYFPLEVHVVHKGVDDPTQLLVLAPMFDLCTSPTSDPLISSLSPHLPSVLTPGSKVDIASGVDFSSVLTTLKSSNLFQYSGSLTTPPCSEGVTFLVMETPLKISVADFSAIKKIVKFNSRVTQNTLGEVNVGGFGAGEEVVGNATACAKVEEVVEKGSRVVVNEISGSALATPILGYSSGAKFRV